MAEVRGWVFKFSTNVTKDDDTTWDDGRPQTLDDFLASVADSKSIKRAAFILHDKDTYKDFEKEKARRGYAEEFKRIHAGEEYTQEAIDAYVDSRDTIVVGTPKKPHIHGVVSTGSCNCKIPLSRVAKWLGLPEHMITVVKGESAEYTSFQYLTHEHPHQCEELGKYRYPDTEIVADFDFRAYIETYEEERLKYGKNLTAKEKMRYDVLYNGKTLRQCMAEDKILYMQDYKELQRLRLQYISLQTPPKTRLNYYISGKGGAGKGLLSKALARSMYPQYEDDEDIFFEVGAKGAAFEGYDGQPVIIWNDRRAIALLMELGGRGNVFNVFDTHPTKQRQNVKFASINLCNAVNIVNSPQDYVDFLEGLAGGYTDRNGDEHEAEDKGQSYRRFPFIIPVHQEDFDLLLNKGFVEDTDNYEEYIEHKRIIGNMQKIHVICGANEKLAKEIEAQTVKPVIIEHEKVVEKFRHESPAEEVVRMLFADYGSQREEPPTPPVPTTPTEWDDDPPFK